MIVKNICIPSSLRLIPLGDRYFRLAEQVTVSVETDEGVFRYTIGKGFVTNFRSGAPVIDCFIDAIGDRLHQICWLVHDCNYTPCINKCGVHAVDRKTADDLLFAMLLFAGESKFKARVVWGAVRMFGKSAYEDDDAFTFDNYQKLVANYWRK